MDYLAHIRSESARFVEVLREADPAAPVPSCPDWTAADLLAHLSQVQWFWATIIRDRVQDPGALDEPTPPESYAARLDLFDTNFTALVDALANTDDDVAVWTWYPPLQNVGFIRRRQAHEVLIHRRDAELVTGTVTAFDPALADDGVTEFLERMAAAPAWATSRPTGPVGTLHATDTGRSWTIQVVGISGTHPGSGNTYVDHPGFAQVSGDAAFTVSGPVGELDAWVWNRPATVELSGDVGAAVDVVSSGVQ